MNGRTLIYTLLFLTTLFSCSKTNNKEMMIVKDCTGSYLKFEGKDYHICNTKFVENFENGTVVRASFKKIDNCSNSNSNGIICAKFHPNEGWINVTKIE